MADLLLGISIASVVILCVLCAGVARIRERTRWIEWVLTQDDDVVTSAHEWLKREGRDG